MAFSSKGASILISFNRQRANASFVKRFLKSFGPDEIVYGDKRYGYSIADLHTRGMCSEGISGSPLRTVASIQNRTRSLLKAVCDAQNEQSKLIRLESFNEHVLTYLNVGRSEAIRAGALDVILKIKKSKNAEVKKEARKGLALLGWVEPVKGWGIRVLCIDGGGSR
jgi:hypothetical protein